LANADYLMLLRLRRILGSRAE